MGAPKDRHRYERVVAFAIANMIAGALLYGLASYALQGASKREAPGGRASAGAPAPLALEPSSPADSPDAETPHHDVAWACSSDGKSVLRSEGGSWRAWRACRGPKGCQWVEGADKTLTAVCDRGIPNRGDACDDGLGERSVCSADHRGIFDCIDRRYVLRSCPAGKACAWPAILDAPDCI